MWPSRPRVRPASTWRGAFEQGPKIDARSAGDKVYGLRNMEKDINGRVTGGTDINTGARRDLVQQRPLSPTGTGGGMAWLDEQKAMNSALRDRVVATQSGQDPSAGLPSATPMLKALPVSAPANPMKEYGQRAVQGGGYGTDTGHGTRAIVGTYGSGTSRTVSNAEQMVRNGAAQAPALMAKAGNAAGSVSNAIGQGIRNAAGSAYNAITGGTSPSQTASAPQVAPVKQPDWRTSLTGNTAQAKLPPATGTPSLTPAFDAYKATPEGKSVVDAVKPESPSLTPSYDAYKQSTGPALKDPSRAYNAIFTGETEKAGQNVADMVRANSPDDELKKKKLAGYDAFGM